MSNLTINDRLKQNIKVSLFHKCSYTQNVEFTKFLMIMFTKKPTCFVTGTAKEPYSTPMVEIVEIDFSLSVLREYEDSGVGNIT